MKHYFDIFIIDDIRLELEINEIKKHFKNVITLKIERPNFVSELSDKQKMHLTEVGLDKFDKYDYVIKNDGDLTNLSNKVDDFLEWSDIK